MQHWRRRLTHDPVPPLCNSSHPAVAYFARRDLDGVKMPPIETLWDVPEVTILLRRQRDNGGWRYRGGQTALCSREDYNQIELYRTLGFLVEMYGMNRRHPALAEAAEFVFAFQTDAGDFRGIYGNQYTPNYTAAMVELLVKAGYQDDPRVDRAFQWLLSMRQDDGGWALPVRTRGVALDIETIHDDTIDRDPSQPFSHFITGVVLRAFAAHPHYRRLPEVRSAAMLLADRLFERDSYADRGGVEFWTKFTFPFWFTDLLSALDSLSLLGCPSNHPKVNEALKWFLEHQGDDGLWDLYTLKNKDASPRLWISLAVCRVLKRFGVPDATA
jgi:hypothetical protein